MRIRSLAAAVFALSGMICAAGKADAGLFISVGVAPPILPVYTQPPIPGPGYIWTPGYWAYNGEVADYYWVPGAWVPAPAPGLLWTPGYWGWSNGVYVWNAGYWGPHVGFYGGVSYGYGYTGAGFAGGYWSGGAFFYNRSVANIGGTTVITNVYNKTVIVNNRTNVSFNGGSGGLSVRPTPGELAAANEHHIEATRDQLEHQRLASENRDLRHSVNGGRPSIAAVSRAGDYSARNVVAARGAGPVKPASLKTGGAPNGNQLGKNTGGNNVTATPHPNAGLAKGSSGATGVKPFNTTQGNTTNEPAGGTHFDATHGTGKNAVANLNTGAGTNGGPKNRGPNLTERTSLQGRLYASEARPQARAAASSKRPAEERPAPQLASYRLPKSGSSSWSDSGTCIGLQHARKQMPASDNPLLFYAKPRCIIETKELSLILKIISRDEEDLCNMVRRSCRSPACEGSCAVSCLHARPDIGPDPSFGDAGIKKQRIASLRRHSRSRLGRPSC